MVNGAYPMKQLSKALSAALLLIGLAAIVPTSASAGTYYDTVCNCRRPDSEYNSQRYVHEAPRVVNRTRYVDHTREVRGDTRLIQENRLIVHVRPVINREVVVHRTNTVVRDVILHKVNTTNKFREEVRNEVINREEGGSVRHITERREVQGVNCNCGYGGGGYSGGSHYREASYRD
jgi:hypothetical protein